MTPKNRDKRHRASPARKNQDSTLGKLFALRRRIERVAFDLHRISVAPAAPHTASREAYQGVSDLDETLASLDVAIVQASQGRSVEGSVATKRTLAAVEKLQHLEALLLKLIPLQQNPTVQ